MRTPPMGMSGVQVLGTGVEGGVAEGRYNSTRCIRHGKRDDHWPPPRTPVCPRQLPMHDHYWVIKASRGQSIGFERADELHAVQRLVG